jgi:hypothetical protein
MLNVRIFYKSGGENSFRSSSVIVFVNGVVQYIYGKPDHTTGQPQTIINMDNIASLVIE